jgi:hypothetical protein
MQASALYCSRLSRTVEDNRIVQAALEVTHTHTHSLTPTHTSSGPRSHVFQQDRCSSAAAMAEGGCLAEGVPGSYSEVIEMRCTLHIAVVVCWELRDETFCFCAPNFCCLF